MDARLRAASLSVIDEDGRPEKVLLGQFFLLRRGFYGAMLIQSRVEKTEFNPLLARAHAPSVVGIWRLFLIPVWRSGWLSGRFQALRVSSTAA